MSAIAPSLAIRSRRGSTEARDLEEAELILQIRELQRKLARITHPEQHGSFSATRSTMDDTKNGTESPPVAAIRRLREASPGPSQRLVIVANRLPLTLSRDKTGNWTFKVSSGGLVSALTSVDDLPMVWVGWPGAVVEDDEEREKLTQSLLANNYIPVWMSQSVADRYYNGYSNTILWPLFHYIPLPMKDLYSSAEMWEAYEEANRLFAATVLKYVQRGDLTWIHDYQLMLLPGLLRAGRPRMKIGFFLHIPFPASEIYRVLPQRAEILQSLVSSDLIGFHVYDYARHFKSSCIRILGVEVNGNRVEHGTSSCIVGTYPIGIDASKFSKAIDTPEVKAHIDELEEKFKGRKVIVGIDRLDYIKGIPHRLYAMECFFENNPEWVGKVVLVQIAVPSRTDVKEYQRLAKETHELVGRINGRFGSLDSLPIHYLDQSIPFHRMCALYRVADVCVNTSLRDGMNLVSHEYVACQQGKSGVLILSEFTGAAQSLGAGCLRVNPWDVVEVADAIKEALCMGEAERTVYHEYSSKYVLEHSAQNWADYFVEALDRCQPPEAVEIIPPKLDFKDACDKFNSAKGQRLLVLGLVSTLTQKRKSGVNFDMYNRFAKISPDTAKSLVKLSNMPHTSVLIITSRSQQVCEKTCSNVGAWVASENGYFMQTPESKEWTEFYGEADLAWMSEVEEVFNYFSDRTPNSVVEKEKSYISWHYRDSDPEFGEAQARELLNHLKTGPLMNSATEVVHSNRLVQVRPAGVSKGHTVEKLVQKLQAEEPVGFVLSLGNFLTKDEDMFSLLEKKLHVEQSPKTPTASEPGSPNAELVTVTIGAKTSRAKNYVRSVDDVENLLAQMASRKEERMAVVSSTSGLENRPKSKFSGLQFSWVEDNVPFI